MMGFSNLQFFQRLVHDLYTSIGIRCRHHATEVEAQEILGVQSFVVQKAGEAEFRHPLEEVMYGSAYSSSRISWPEIKCYQMPQVLLAGEEGAVYIGKQRRLSSSSSVWSSVERKVRRPISILSRFQQGPLFHLIGKNHDNRAHFLLEHLPRYFASRKTSKITGAKLLVSCRFIKWQSDFLELLGENPERLVEVTFGTIRAHNLFFTPFLATNGQYCDPKIFQEMISEMQGSIASKGWGQTIQSTSNQSRVLWVSRRDAPDRQINNEEALVKVARGILGQVEVVHLSSLPLHAQISKIQNSDIIIGAQGQGIANAVFVRGKTVIILDQGTMSVTNNSWGEKFRDMAEMSGNQAVRIFSGSPAKSSTSNWDFPENVLAELLYKLMPIITKPIIT